MWRGSGRWTCTHTRLDAQSANPHVGRLSMSGDTPYHEIRWNVELYTGRCFFCEQNLISALGVMEEQSSNILETREASCRHLFILSPVATPVKVWVNAILTGSLSACSPQEKCKLP